MTQYYECHVTMEFDPRLKPGHPDSREAIQATVEELGWRFSAIDGDPVLGLGVKCYATKQYPKRLGEEIVVGMVRDTAGILREAGIKVLREKVELVVYDTKNVRPA